MTDLEHHGPSRHRAGHIATLAQTMAAPGTLAGLSTTTEHPASAETQCKNGEQDIVR
jgi:hypothetical protein